MMFRRPAASVATPTAGLGTECTGGTTNHEPIFHDQIRREQAHPDVLVLAGLDQGSIREYRRRRTHLFPLEEYRAATAVGGTLRS